MQRWIIRLLPFEILLLSCGLVAGGFMLIGTRWASAAPPLQPAAAMTPAPLASLAPLFTPEVQHWAEKIQAWAAAAGVDPELAATVMQIESCGNPQAVSGSGAQGLFQVMPFHFAAGDNMLDPDTNARYGLSYLALGLTRAGDNAGLALAGYNGGHGLIGLAQSLWPNQTQRYWYWGTGIYADAVAGQSSSPRLQEWLAAGGASLCAQADQVLKLTP